MSTTLLSNRPPRTRWFKNELACGIVRHRLYVGERETPFFVDDAKKAGIGHRAEGHVVGLFGSGMGPEIRRRDGGSYRIAALLQGCKSVTLAKMVAERRASA